MAKLGKIDLRGLYANGDLTVQLFNFTEAGDSNGIFSMFDNLGKKTFIKGTSPGNPTIRLTFATPILSKKILVRLSTHECNIAQIYVGNVPSAGEPDHANLFTATDNTPPGGAPDVTDFVFNTGEIKGQTANSLNRVQITLGNPFSSNYYVSSLEIFNLELTESDKVEFNDSVLDSLAWKSSRYNGRQLSGSGINIFNAGDISYGKTPVIRNNSRTFYVANEIVSLGVATEATGSTPRFTQEVGLPEEDPSLQFIPNFSYVLINKSITINGDNTISERDLGISEDNDEQRGMQREFQSNVKIGDNIQLINFDTSIKNRSNSKYKVYFNRGRLQPFLRLLNLDPNDSTQQGRPLYTKSNGNISLTATISGNTKLKPITKNKDILQRFFTGSFEALNIKSIITKEETDLITDNMFEDTATTGKPFITFLKSSGSDDRSTDRDFEPIRTIESPAGIFKTENLAELSTVELLGGGISNFQASSASPLNQNYTALHNNISGVPNIPFPNGFYSGSIDLSILNEEKPALLINMNKEIELPDGKGSKPIIVVPPNLHPFVKDNLTHFCAKAGLDIGDRKVVPDLNNRFANLL